MTQYSVGIRRETKTEHERRVALIPSDIAHLRAEHKLAFYVERSSARVYDDDEYAVAGAQLCDSMPPCDLIVGIKEFPPKAFQPLKTHLMYSHTIKGQTHNMAMLRHAIKVKATLVDYEVMIDDRGRARVQSSYTAGQAGMVNTLWGLGLRWAERGYATPLASLEQAQNLGSVAAAEKGLADVGKMLRQAPLHPDLAPIVCGIVGTGNVAKGARSMLASLDPVRLSPPELAMASLSGSLQPNRVYEVVFNMRHHFGRQVNEPAGHGYLPYLSMIVNGNYWDESLPRIITKADISALFDDYERPKLEIIGDVSCDIEGGIECTLKSTFPDEPLWDYDPARQEVLSADRHLADGLLMMTVEILPTEFARDASHIFSQMLTPVVAELAQADFGQSLDAMSISSELKRATVLQQGRLTPRFKYLKTKVR